MVDGATTWAPEKRGATPHTRRGSAAGKRVGASVRPGAAWPENALDRAAFS